MLGGAGAQVGQLSRLSPAALCVPELRCGAGAQSLEQQRGGAAAGSSGGLWAHLRGVAGGVWRAPVD